MSAVPLRSGAGEPRIWGGIATAIKRTGAGTGPAMPGVESGQRRAVG